MILKLVNENNQSEESLRENGKCFSLQHPDQKDESFSNGQYCENKYPGISNKQVEATYKEGNFGMRWAVAFKVQD